MSHRSPHFLLSCLASLSLLPVNGAETVRFTEPDADTYVISAQPDKVFGDGPSFQVRRADNRKYSRIGYVRFDLGDRLNSKVEDAKLVFVLGGIFRNRETPSEIKVYGWLGGDWDEASLKDSTAYWSSRNIEQPPADATLLGSFTVPETGGAPGGTPFEVADTRLTAFLEKAREAQMKKVTFLVVEAEKTPNVVTFVTKENPSFPATSLTVVLAGNS